MEAAAIVATVTNGHERLAVGILHYTGLRMECSSDFDAHLTGIHNPTKRLVFSITDHVTDLMLVCRHTVGDGAFLEVGTGMPNLPDSHQRNLDGGHVRAAAYIHGPMLPRTFFVVAKLHA